MKSLKEILEAEFVGKILKVTTLTPIKETYQVDVKKSANVTDKQFESGEKKYRMTAIRTRVIDSKFEIKESEIVSINVIETREECSLFKITTKDGWSELYSEDEEIDYFEKI